MGLSLFCHPFLFFSEGEGLGCGGLRVSGGCLIVLILYNSSDVGKFGP